MNVRCTAKFPATYCRSCERGRGDELGGVHCTVLQNLPPLTAGHVSVGGGYAGWCTAEFAATYCRTVAKVSPDYQVI